MRIAQLTLDGYENYGQVLQRYALQRVLKNFADFVEVLWHQKGKNFSPYNLEWSRSSVGNLKNEVFKGVRQNKIKEFNDVYIRTRFDFPYFKEIGDEYDFFVVGSDQVWNPNSLPPNIFLEFVPREKKVSYAASLGVNAIPDDKKEFMRSGISDFNYISVREESAIKLIKDLTGRDSILVLDPVLLLTADEWLAVAQKPTWFKERYSGGYVLTYHLSKLPPPPRAKH